MKGLISAKPHPRVCQAQFALALIHRARSSSAIRQGFSYKPPVQLINAWDAAGAADSHTKLVIISSACDRALSARGHFLPARVNINNLPAPTREQTDRGSEERFVPPAESVRSALALIAIAQAARRRCLFICPDARPQNEFLLLAPSVRRIVHG